MFDPYSAFRFALLVCAAAVCLGCATTPYQYGRLDKPPSTDREDEITIAYGRPNRFADGIGYIVGFPERLLALHPRINDHRFSSGSKEELASYLKKNKLTDVYVRVNQYDPLGEWRRLRHNTRIAAGWRYSFGLGEWLVYTLVPGRIVGGDLYNPFTNSLYVNSDVAAVVLHEAAYAKDVHCRSFPGVYSAVNEFPVLSLWRHVRGVNEVLGYARSNNDWELEQETYRVVYPLMGSHAAVAGGQFVAPMIAPVLHMAGALTGRAAGELTVMYQRKKSSTKDVPEEHDRRVQLAGHETEGD